MSTRDQIGAELEAFGLEMVALRERMRAAGARFHAQGMGRGAVLNDATAFQAYCWLWDASRPLYSHGHQLKRFGRQLRLDLGDGKDGNGGRTL